MSRYKSSRDGFCDRLFPLEALLIQLRQLRAGAVYPKVSLSGRRRSVALVGHIELMGAQLGELQLMGL